MLATGLYMNDFSMHDTSQEMVLSGIKPLPQLEYARDQVKNSFVNVTNTREKRLRVRACQQESLSEKRKVPPL